jgi:hypothetical protein
MTFGKKATSNGKGDMSPFIKSQSQKATRDDLKINGLKNLEIWGVAHNLVLAVMAGETTILYNRITND